MKTIASFEVNHDTLMPGLYLSRQDGEAVTYDLRFIRPNTPPYMEPAAMHTIEHLMATYLRNSEESDHIIYFGPMGCRTGFYVITQGMSHEAVIALLQAGLAFTARFEGAIPGTAAPRECGNWLEHDLPEARRLCAEMLPVLEGYTPARLVYPA